MQKKEDKNWKKLTDFEWGKLTKKKFMDPYKT